MQGHSVSALQPRAPQGQGLRAFAQNRLAAAAAAALLVLIAFVTLGPWMAQDAEAFDVQAIYRAPQAAHAFGTDQLGRDLMARVMAGGRVSLAIGLLATALTTALGIAYGLLSALGPRWLDHLMMQVLDTFLAIPVILLAILIQAAGEPGLGRLALAIGAVSWLGVARIVRTEVLRVLPSDFVTAATASGTRLPRLITRHLLPNIAAPLLVVLTASIGQALILEATLSFLNLGVPSSVPSWGNLLGNGLSAALNGAWWCVLFPGFFVMATVLAINLVGDGLRDLVDPRNRVLA